MDSDVTVLRKSDCGEDDPVSFWNNCPLHGNPAFVWVWPDASAVDCAGSYFQ